MTRWLLRANRRIQQEHRFQLLGPMSREEVLSAIKNGTIELGDEACPENSYWFSFHESEELHRHLGVSWAQIRKESQKGSEEEGLTTTVTEEETDEITHTSTQPGFRASTKDRTPGVPEVPAQGAQERGFFSEVPSWLWGLAALIALVAAYGFFGSTK